MVSKYSQLSGLFSCQGYRVLHREVDGVEYTEHTVITDMYNIEWLDEFFQRKLKFGDRHIGLKNQ
jgi:hypothetical protein